MKNNYVYLILDESRSMINIRDEVINATNAIIETVRKRGAKRGQKTHITFQTFSDSYNKPILNLAPVDALKEITRADYEPSGMTALFDTIGQGVIRMEALDLGKNDSVLFLIITDGENNKFFYYDEQSIKDFIKKHEDNYTFGFQVPPNRSKLIVKRFGIPAENISEWEATAEGTREMSEQTCAAVGNYYDDRAAGKRMSSRLFAKVQSDVKPASIKRHLENLAKEFKQYVVGRESAIREFVEDKTGKDYVPGSTFYQLMKPETVQPSKEVVLQEKGKKAAIYGGHKAREIIGLPAGQYAKVTPGNHQDYDVFVQSKSLNRILPRGTKVLVKCS